MFFGATESGSSRSQFVLDVVWIVLPLFFCFHMQIAVSLICILVSFFATFSRQQDDQERVQEGTKATTEQGSRRQPIPLTMTNNLDQEEGCAPAQALLHPLYCLVDGRNDDFELDTWEINQKGIRCLTNAGVDVMMKFIRRCLYLQVMQHPPSSNCLHWVL